MNDLRIDVHAETSGKSSQTWAWLTKVKHGRWLLDFHLFLSFLLLDAYCGWWWVSEEINLIAFVVANREGAKHILHIGKLFWCVSSFLLRLIGTQIEDICLLLHCCILKQIELIWCLLCNKILFLEKVILWWLGLNKILRFIFGEIAGEGATCKCIPRCWWLAHFFLLFEVGAKRSYIERYFLILGIELREVNFDVLNLLIIIFELSLRPLLGVKMWENFIVYPQFEAFPLLDDVKGEPVKLEGILERYICR